MKLQIHTRFWATILLLLNGCEPVWIPDPIDPRLPKYTENGNGVAGALVNGKLWKAVRYCYFDFGGCDGVLSFQPNSDGSLSASIDGSMAGEDHEVTFEFKLADQPFATLADKLSLSNKKFILGDVNTVAIYDAQAPCIQGFFGEGQIYFKRVAKRKDSDIVDYSGTFGFTLAGPLSCGFYEVYYGRFDYGLSD
jgi:hypothetical protein